MGFCKNCGGWVLKEDLKCPKCGLDPNAKMSDAAAVGSAAVPVAAGAGETAPSSSWVFMASFRKSLSFLRENPYLYIAGLLVGAATAVLRLMVDSRSFFSLETLVSLVLLVLVGVFFSGGGLSAADDIAKSGRFSFGGFIRGGKRNYKRLLAGEVLFFLAIIAAMLPASFIGCLGIFLMILVLCLSIAFSFYSVIIVVDGVGVLESFERSYSFVRGNLGQVLGYVVLSSLASFFLMMPMFLYNVIYLVLPYDYYGSAWYAYPLMLFLSLLQKVEILLTALSYAFGVLYGVLFYRSLAKGEK